MKLKYLLAAAVTLLLLHGCFSEDGVSMSSYPSDGGGGWEDNDYYSGSEKSSVFEINSFVNTADDPLSTFGLDVDNGSYTFHRKKVEGGTVPSPDAIRVEEFINYFDYSYDEPAAGETFSIQTSTAESPFKDSVINLVVAMKGVSLPSGERKPWNLTFLIDISGSMNSRIGQVQKSLGYLVDSMKTGDKISIGTYAGNVGTVLTPTSLEIMEKETIKGIIQDLNCGGGTAMGDGMANAYQLNKQGFIENGVNRVIVCSDGDANIGASSYEEILDRIDAYVEQGITMTTLGFGRGNYNDRMMEMLANRGNGNYYYVDSEQEAQRLFSEELLSLMNVIATDARIQIEFSETSVQAYRLLGYENRNIDDDAFDDDTTDAGEVGEGHTVTALYELILSGNEGDLGTVSLRYKDTTGIFRQVETIIGGSVKQFSEMSDSYKQAVVVGEYAEILRESMFTGTSLNMVHNVAENSSITAGSKFDEFMVLLNKVISLK